MDASEWSQRTLRRNSNNRGPPSSMLEFLDMFKLNIAANNRGPQSSMLEFSDMFELNIAAAGRIPNTVNRVPGVTTRISTSSYGNV